MIELNPNFVDGQITCPECGEKFFDRGQIGGTLRWIPSHSKCKGAGTRVPLKALADEKAREECIEHYQLLLILNNDRPLESVL